MSEVEQIILPEGFKKVEFLQSTGNEVIYTGIIPTDKHGFYAEVESCGGTGYGCGTQTGAGAPGFWIYVNNGVLQASYENNTKTTISSNGKSIIKNNFLNDRKLVSDKSIVKNYSQDFTYNWTYEFTLFKSTYGGNTKFDPVAPIRFYRFKISENEKIIRDFVPCLDHNDVPCMYDILGTGTIEENTYYNQGTGKFLTPKDLEWNYPPINNNYNLPAGFKKCVYLQSDGTQWIDTGVIPDNETGIYFNALQLSYGDLVPFGVTDGGNEIHPPRFNNKNLLYRWGTSAIKMMTWDKAGDLIFHSSLNLYNSKIAKFDSEDTDVETYITSQTGTYTLPIWLFSYNFKGSYNSTYGKWAGRVYRAQITQGDALIHDYVPCLDADGRPCMYDIVGGGTVEDNTYYNQSGGTEFAYCVEHQLPSDFIKLKYLESNGTQYINTDYVPTNTTGLYIDTQDVGSGDTVTMGTRNDTGNTRFFMTRQTASHSAGYGWGTWTQISSTTGSVRYDSTLNWLNDRKSITNNPLFSQIVKTLSDLSFTPTYSIYMFGVNQANVHSYKFKGRIYRAKISEGSEIVRDFVPAWDERKLKPCMYDLINNVAYYNDGSGEFLHNRDFEGTYKGYTGLGCIGNRLGGDYNPIDEKLPSGYTRVDFLEANNLQYIDTKIPPSGDMKITVDVMATKWVYVNYVFGNYQKSGANIVFSMNYNNGNGTAGIYRYGTQSQYFAYGTHKLNTRYHYVFDGPIVYRNGKEVSLAGGTKFTPEEFEGTTPLLLFISHHDNWQFYGEGTKRIWNFTIERQGQKLLDYIPAIDNDGKPCMFDLVTQQPFYNSGSGNFVVGLKSISHALQLYLPESGGTIDLSLPTNDNIEYYEAKIRANNPNWTISFQYH